jgi:hypothetical protein
MTEVDEKDWDAIVADVLTEGWEAPNVEFMWDLVAEALRRQDDGVEMSDDFTEAVGGMGYMLVGLAMLKRGVDLDTLDTMFARPHHFKFTYRREEGQDEGRFGIDVIFDQDEENVEVLAIDQAEGLD